MRIPLVRKRSDLTLGFSIQGVRNELGRNGPVVQSAKFVIGGAFSDRFRFNFTAPAIHYLCTGVLTGCQTVAVAVGVGGGPLCRAVM